jgi:mannose-6-phosphate isomerase-like protein (cupin superfamily)
MSVPIIADRGGKHEATPPERRVFQILEYASLFDSVRPTRMYTGDAFRVAVFRLAPGQAQETHMHTTTTHAWFVVSGKGKVTLEDGLTEFIDAGSFCVHPVMCAHGIENAGEDDLVYVVLSTEQTAVKEVAE